MSHHIKSLFNHLTAINNYTNANANTNTSSNSSSSSSSSLPQQTPQQITKLKPFTTLKKPLVKEKLTSIQRSTRRRLITTTTNTPPPPTQPPPLLQLLPSHRQTTITDSGLETSISSSMMRQQSQKQKCQCETCSRHTKHRINIAKRLRQAYTKIKTHHSLSNSSQYYAHIPLLVVKSYRPTTTNESKRKEIYVKKNTAINALFMVSKWLYVKTSDDLYGFIPRKSCQPFVNNSFHTNTNENNVKNHTYASIGDLEQNINEEQTDLSLFMVSNCYYNNDLSLNEENYEFLPDLETKSTTKSKKTNNSYIDLRDVETLPVSTQIIYECLNELKSSSLSSLSTTYDYLNGCQSSSSSTSSNEPNNHYDILMTYKSTRHDTNNYVNASSSSTSNCSTPNNNNNNNNNRKMNLFKVVKDYEASFKGDLSVNKGDLVYLIDNAKKSVYLNLNQQNNQCNNDDNEWAFVRLFRRTRVTNEKRNECNNNNNNIYENLNDLKQLNNMQLLQGFVPRSCFIKI
jgi:hypothetical protein